MDTNTGTVARRAVGVLIAGILLVGCEDATGPGPLPEEGAAADETILDQAAVTVDDLGREMAVDAERESDRQRGHDRAGDDHRPPVDRVGLAVELGSTAVALAARILDEQGAGEAQLRLLEQATRFQRQAEAALAEADAARAVALASNACWTALKAVVLPGGVTEAEARFVHDLAEGLLEAARAEVAAGGMAVEEVMLGWAARFFEVGSAQLAGGDLRGVAALWKSAVVSSWIVG